MFSDQKTEIEVIDCPVTESEKLFWDFISQLPRLECQLYSSMGIPAHLLSLTRIDRVEGVVKENDTGTTSKSKIDN